MVPEDPHRMSAFIMWNFHDRPTDTDLGLWQKGSFKE